MAASVNHALAATELLATFRPRPSGQARIQVEGAEAQKFLARISVRFACTVVHVEDASGVGIDDLDAVARTIQKRAKLPELSPSHSASSIRTQ
jgi:hypothetical protein